MARVYPSKLLLFGEYTVIQQSAALAIPYYKYTTFWSDGVIPENFELSLPEEACKKGLWSIYEDLLAKDVQSLDLAKLEKDLKDGLWLVSNSPIGYGLGSSGAVCAALLDRYGVDSIEDRTALQQTLAALECSFHGKSSGIDPLVSFLQQPLWVQAGGKVVPTSLAPLSSSSIFLIDSQHPRVSTPLINFFVEQCKKDSFLQDFVVPVAAAVDQAIAAWQQDDGKALLSAVQLISEKQLLHLHPMVLPAWRSLWEKGLESQDFYLKICGAGGGGFLLGFAENWERAAGYLDEKLAEQLLL